MKLEFAIAFLLLLISACGCTTKPAPVMEPGQHMGPPSGAIAFCARPENKTDEHCTP